MGRLRRGKRWKQFPSDKRTTGGFKCKKYLGMNRMFVAAGVDVSFEGKKYSMPIHEGSKFRLAVVTVVKGRIRLGLLSRHPSLDQLLGKSYVSLCLLNGLPLERGRYPRNLKAQKTFDSEGDTTRNGSTSQIDWYHIYLNQCLLTASRLLTSTVVLGGLFCHRGLTFRSGSQ